MTCCAVLTCIRKGKCAGHQMGASVTSFQAAIPLAQRQHHPAGPAAPQPPHRGPDLQHTQQYCGHHLQARSVLRFLRVPSTFLSFLPCLLHSQQLCRVRLQNCVCASCSTLHAAANHRHTANHSSYNPTGALGRSFSNTCNVVRATVADQPTNQAGNTIHGVRRGTACSACDLCLQPQPLAWAGPQPPHLSVLLSAVLH
jgi:hypothetical protein